MAPSAKWARRALLVEAAATLLLARLAVRVVPFRYLVVYLSRPPRRPAPSGVRRGRLRQEVRRAIVWTARRLPGHTVCLPRAIAAQALLRRRGVAAVLYYGAATTPGRGLTAHAWVQDGAYPVVGYSAAQPYRVLACYPHRQP